MSRQDLVLSLNRSDGMLSRSPGTASGISGQMPVQDRTVVIESDEPAQDPVAASRNRAATVAVWLTVESAGTPAGASSGEKYEERREALADDEVARHLAF
jgi:hypothetical protein